MMRTSFLRIQARARKRKTPKAKRIWPRTARRDCSCSGVREGGRSASGILLWDWELDADLSAARGLDTRVRSLVQTGKNGFDGLVRGQVCRVDGKAGETAIEGV